HHVWLFDYTAGKSRGEFFHGSLKIDCDERDADAPDESDDYGDEWHLYSQVFVDSYHLDFVIETSYGQLVIECDGHEFHDRTKQQAAYDRSRDRLLALNGITVIRFTGSEIHHSADRCADEAFLIARAIDKRESALAHAGAFPDGSWMEGA